MTNIWRMFGFTIYGKPAAGNWVGVGVAIGAAVFAVTQDPVWIAVGVAVGAGLDWTRHRKDCRPDKED